ncbi:fibro-slime domain-containing protein [Candidatus Halobeggiatoa sp. HSG11]|nr:fibro-slime domain-containing protein [Candidatus Halobeggiatoa sp. HSG11]
MKYKQTGAAVQAAFLSLAIGLIPLFAVAEEGDTTNVQPTEKPETITLTGIVRDFSSEHIDFEGNIPGLQKGCVENELGADGKPVMIEGNSCEAKQISDWYSDAHDSQLTQTYDVTLKKNDRDVYAFDSDSFFPVDGKLGGNEGRSHNYHFTFEVRGEFTYRSGQVFQFRGDDDVWVFINNQLAVDIGGVHTAEKGEVNLDELGLTEGENYPFVLFFAERHTTQSNFRMEMDLMVAKTNPAAEINFEILDVTMVQQLEVYVFYFFTVEYIVKLEEKGLVEALLPPQVARIPQTVINDLDAPLKNKLPIPYLEDTETITNLMIIEFLAVNMDIGQAPKGWNFNVQTGQFDLTPEAANETNLPPQVIQTMTPDQTLKLSPLVFSYFTVNQVISFTADSWAVFTPEIIANFDSAIFESASTNQISSLPTTINFTFTMIESMSISACAGLQAEHFAQMPIEVIPAFTTAKLAAPKPEALDGLSIEHALEIAPHIFNALPEEHKKHLPITYEKVSIPAPEIEENTETTEAEESNEITESTTENEVETEVNSENESEVEIVEEEVNSEDESEVQVVETENEVETEVNSANESELEIDLDIHEVVTEIETTLINQNVSVEAQSDEVILITNEDEKSAYTVAEISEASENVNLGQTIDENGFQMFVTESFQIKLNPAPMSIEQLITAMGTEQHVEIKKHGTVILGDFAVMFDATVQEAFEEIPNNFSVFDGYGFFTSSERWMQMMQPSILLSTTQLTTAISSSFGLEMTFEFQANGTAEFELEGESMKIVAEPQINPECSTDEPSAELVDIEEGKMVATFDESSNEAIEHPVIMKAEVANETGCQILNVIPE